MQIEEFEEIHLLDYLQVLLKRKWVIIATFVCIVTGTIFFTFIAQPIYQATAKIKIGKEKVIYPTIRREVEYLTSDLADIALYKTHAEMIRSFPVLYRTAKKLGLDKSAGVEGEVKEISITETKIITKKDDLIIIPNYFMVKSKNLKVKHKSLKNDAA